ncbi:MAG: PP2C family protein-serine/threonine phosphatase, partial [Flavobacteriales bacterium]
GKQEGDHFYLAAVDCTGHGVPGGFMSMLGVSFLNEIMANEKDLKPGEILSRLKERVVNELSGTQGVQAKDGMDMAMLKIPNPKSQSPKGEEVEVEFAGAQNPLYLIREGVAEDPPVLEVYRNGEEVDEKVSKPFRDSSDGLEIQADKAGIGSEEHGVEHFRTVSFKVQKGDALYIFSDGYADQFGGPKGKKFRYGAFKRVLTELQDRSMEDQKRELGKQFEEWKGDQEQVDDVLVMGVRL